MTRRPMPLYLMIKPPLTEREALRSCARRHGLDGSYAPEKYHCTLVRLGESRLWPPAALDLLGARLAALRAEPFAVVFDLLDGRALRPCKGLRRPGEFQRAAARLAAGCGVTLPESRFRLHLSLAYAGDPAPRARIAPIGWRVGEVLLIRSVHGVGYQQLGRWPLVPRQLELDFRRAAIA